MSDEDECAGKLEEVLFEDFERGDVEVVGGLVEEEDVGRLEHELGDEDAGAFAAGEVADGLVELFAGEEEARGPTGDVDDAALVVDAITFRGERTTEGQVFVEVAHLAEVDEAEGFGALDGALSWLDFAAEESEEGCFAAAVGTYEADFRDEVEVGEENAGCGDSSSPGIWQVTLSNSTRRLVLRMLASKSMPTVLTVVRESIWASWPIMALAESMRALDLVLRAFKNARGCGLSLVTLEITLRNCGFNRVEAALVGRPLLIWIDEQARHGYGRRRYNTIACS